MSTELRELTPQETEFVAGGGPENWVDANNNGVYDAGDSIVITGSAFTRSGAGGGGGGGDWRELQSDSATLTPTDPDELRAAEPLPTPCVETTFATPGVSLTDANRAALAASNVIAQQNDETYEYSSIIFFYNGQVGFTEPFTNRSPDHVDWLNAEILSNIPDGAVIVGVVHSHPDARETNDTIPSNEGAQGGYTDDWMMYNQMVGMAVGTLPRGITVDSNMLLYIYSDEDRKTHVYDKTDKNESRTSCSLQ